MTFLLNDGRRAGALRDCFILHALDMFVRRALRSVVVVTCLLWPWPSNASSDSSDLAGCLRDMRDGLDLISLERAGTARGKHEHGSDALPEQMLLRQAAAGICSGSCTPVLITLPDPSNAALEGLHDRALEGAVSALARERDGRHQYVLDGNWLPWVVDAEASSPSKTSKDEKPTAEKASKATNCATLLPGVIRFRRFDDPNFRSVPGELPDHVVLLIVGESPALGINRHALRRARSLAGAFGYHRCLWPRTASFVDDVQCDCTGDGELRVLGPYFSRSASDLMEVLEAASKTEWASYQIATGTATVPTDMFQSARFASFRAFTVERKTHRAAVAALLGAEGSDGGQRRTSEDRRDSPTIALLHESATRFGHSVSEDPAYLSIPFPPTIASLRKAHAENEPVSTRRAPWLTSKLDGDPARSDLFAQRSHDALLGQDLSFVAIRDELRARKINDVMIHFPVPEDVVFTARQLRREMPEARVILLVNDRLFLHPDHAAFLDGALVATPFPNLGPLPLVAGNELSLTLATPAFSRDSSVGNYCAMLALMDDQLPPFCLRESARRGVVGERSPLPAGSCPEKGEAQRLCTHVAVIRRGALWPLHSMPISSPELPPHSVPASWWVAGVAALALAWCRGGAHGRAVPASTLTRLGSFLPVWVLLSVGFLMVTAASRIQAGWVVAAGWVMAAGGVMAACTLAGALVAYRLSDEDGQAHGPAFPVVTPQRLTRLLVVDGCAAGIASVATILAAALFAAALFVAGHSRIVLNRVLHLTSGVSPVAPPLLALAGAYGCWLARGQRSSLAREPEERGAVGPLIIAAILVGLPVTFSWLIGMRRLTLDFGVVSLAAWGGLLLCYVVHILAVFEAARALRRLRRGRPAKAAPDEHRALASECRKRCLAVLGTSVVTLFAVNGYPFHPQRLLDMWAAVLVGASVAGCAAVYFFYPFVFAEWTPWKQIISRRIPAWSVLILLGVLPLYIAVQNYFPAEEYALRSWVGAFFNMKSLPDP